MTPSGAARARDDYQAEHEVGDRASGHEVTIAVVGAIVLLVVYGLWVWSLWGAQWWFAAKPATQGGPAQTVISVAGESLLCREIDDDTGAVC
jgi:hypothetical protein